MFPWDDAAAPGAPFSPTMVPAGQGAGRFDLPDLTPVRYFTELPKHAVAELLQPLRGQTLTAAALRRAGRPLAIVEATLHADASAALVDCCDPARLVEFGIRPDALASSDPTRTQAIARRLFGARAPGFRWWSALTGDWHSVVLFDRALPPGALGFGAPTVLTLDTPAVRLAATTIGVFLP